MTGESKVEIAQRAREAVSRRDLHALAELLASDCEIVPLRAVVAHMSPARMGAFADPPAIRGFFEAWNPDIDEGRAAAERLAEEQG